MTPFATGSVSDEVTIARIAATYHDHNYLVDPHTAVGVEVGLTHRLQDLPLVCMATAHPAKFEDAMAIALPEEAVTHPILDGLKILPDRKTLLPADSGNVKQFIAEFNAP